MDIYFDTFVTRLETALAASLNSDNIAKRVAESDWSSPLRWPRYIQDEVQDEKNVESKKGEIFGFIQRSTWDKYEFRADLGRISNHINNLLGNNDVAIECSDHKDVINSINLVPRAESKDALQNGFSIVIDDSAWDSPVFYRLVTSCLYPFVALPVHIPVAENPAGRIPWRGGDVFKSEAPIVEEDYVWLFRGTDRKPRDIFREGFVPKQKVRLEGSEGRREAIIDELELLERRLMKADEEGGIAEAKRPGLVWYRYRQEDMCTETGISMATRVQSAAVFPRKLEAKYFVDHPWPNINWRSRTGSRLVTYTSAREPQTTYVYGIRLHKRVLRDTAHIQSRNSEIKPWAEIATASVPPDAVRFAIRLYRWPISDAEGWLVKKSVVVRKRSHWENDVPAIVKNEVRVGKDCVLHYRWNSQYRGNLEICAKSVVSQGGDCKLCKEADAKKDEDRKMAEEKKQREDYVERKEAEKKRCPYCNKRIPPGQFDVHVNVVCPSRPKPERKDADEEQNTQNALGDEEVQLFSDDLPPPPPPPPPLPPTNSKR